MTDLTKTVAPKTDQLNADDLLAGKTLTIKITGVRGTDSKEQPIAISYEGDKGKPWKPSLGMRRVLIELWGEDAAKKADEHYTGRSLTLYRDPDVKFGKDTVGGIRVSHASHLDTPEKKIIVTVSKARRVEFVVKALKADAPKAENPLRTKAIKILNEVKASDAPDKVLENYADDLAKIKADLPQGHSTIMDAHRDRKDALAAEFDHTPADEQEAKERPMIDRLIEDIAVINNEADLDAFVNVEFASDIAKLDPASKLRFDAAYSLKFKELNQ